MEDKENSQSGRNPKRRHLRNRRVNAMEYWQKGVLDDVPAKERWSREFRDPRLKQIKAPELNMPEALQVHGLVLNVHRRTCIVRIDGEAQEQVRAIYRATAIEELGEFPAVGDRVVVGQSTEDGDYYLLRVLPRTSALQRPGTRGRSHQQLTQAANIDQVVIVCSVAQPEFNYGFADRFLLAAATSNLPLIMVLNKMDLVDEIPAHILDFAEIVQGLIPVSCENGQGMDKLQKALIGKSSVFSGQSGVGKSSLVNILVPDAELLTGEVRSKDGKGRHTTTSSSLFDLPQGGVVIDTPGIRALGLVDYEAIDLARSFPGFFPDGIFTCKFNDCLHLEEPGCAVQAAIEKDEIPLQRWLSYERILNSDSL